ncbi:MAG: radical SAM protein, partial [Candidatus Heimdallarchaeota archaeon]
MVMNSPNKCKICGKIPQIFSKVLGICPECIKSQPSKVLDLSQISHIKNRAAWNLPPLVPESRDGRQCHLCSNKCFIGEGETGYCGIRENIGGRLQPIAGKNQALLHTYFDPLPTNCCSMYFCPGGTSGGYPHFSYTNGP